MAKLKRLQDPCIISFWIDGRAKEQLNSIAQLGLEQSDLVRTALDRALRLTQEFMATRTQTTPFTYLEKAHLLTKLSGGE